MANWNPPLSFRLSFGWVSINDMRDPANLAHADYTRLMLYKMAMESMAGIEAPNMVQDTNQPFQFGLLGTITPVANAITRDLAEGCISDLDNRMKTMLAHSGKTKDALLAQEIKDSNEKY